MARSVRGASMSAHARRFNNVICFTIFAIAASASALAAPLSATRENNQAIVALKKNKSDTAEKNLLNALGTDPFNPILHLNLGWLFEKEKKYGMAAREYESILRPGAKHPVSNELKFIARFNAGNALAEKKNIAGALEQYQAALDLKPDSKKIKVNIELLFKGGKGQGSGSGGKNKPKKNKKNGNKKQPNQNKNQNQNRRYTNKGNPKPQFNSKDLTREDVKKIMSEIKSAEQRVRSRIYNEKTKTPPPLKDW